MPGFGALRPKFRLKNYSCAMSLGSDVFLARAKNKLNASAKQRENSSEEKCALPARKTGATAAAQLQQTVAGTKLLANKGKNK